MDPAAQIAAFERSIENLEFWITFFTFLVVLGVVVECGIELWELWHHKPIKWPQKIQFTGGVLVVLGVAGELYFGYKSSDVAERLRTANTTLITQLKSDAAKAQLRTAQLEKDAADMQLKTAGANERASKAEETAEKEKFARVKLQALLAAPQLTPEQVKKITEYCRPVANSKIRVRVVASTGNSYGLGIQIYIALRDAGFTVELQQSGQVGYYLRIGSALEDYEATKTIGESFLKAKLGIMGLQGILPTGSPITIMVGEKPIQVPAK